MQVNLDMHVDDKRLRTHATMHIECRSIAKAYLGFSSIKTVLDLQSCTAKYINTYHIYVKDREKRLNSTSLTGLFHGSHASGDVFF